MIEVLSIPKAAVSNSRQQLLVQVKESLCRAFCTQDSIQPQSTISFTPGVPTVVQNDTDTYDVILPIVASGTIVYKPKGSCTTVTKIFAEKFTVGFVNLTAVPGSYTLTTKMQTKDAADIKQCNKAFGYAINTILTVVADV